jgi:hypothetical protein
MTRIRTIFTISGLAMLVGLAACGKDDIRESCDEPQEYQSIVEGKRVIVPEGLDPLDELKEMPLPEARTAPRPPGSNCLTNTPSIRTGD